MTTEEALEATAQLIEKKGWCQYTLVDSKGHICLAQALAEAAFSQYNNCYNAIQKEIGTYEIVSYNDAPGRIVEEIITTIRNAKRWAKDDNI